MKSDAEISLRRLVPRADSGLTDSAAVPVIRRYEADWFGVCRCQFAMPASAERYRIDSSGRTVRRAANRDRIPLQGPWLVDQSRADGVRLS